MVVLGLWIVLQLVSQVSTAAGEATGVAYMAHIGGFITGLALVVRELGGDIGSAGSRGKVAETPRNSVGGQARSDVADAFWAV